MADYTTFLASKRHNVAPSGIEVELDAISGKLFPFQRAITRWALHRGRAAIFADCGLVLQLRMPSRKERRELTCAQCGSAFLLLECQAINGRGRYCSTACARLGRRHGSDLFCAWCDVGFYRRFGEQGDSITQFCSKDCYAEWRAAKRVSYPKDGHRHRHRVVAESVLGRPLLSGEVVHHIDNNRQNCHPSNLAVFPSQSHHMRCHRGSMSAVEFNAFRLRP